MKASSSTPVQGEESYFGTPPSLEKELEAYQPSPPQGARPDDDPPESQRAYGSAGVQPDQLYTAETFATILDQVSIRAANSTTPTVRRGNDIVCGISPHNLSGQLSLRPLRTSAPRSSWIQGSPEEGIWFSVPDEESDQHYRTVLVTGLSAEIQASDVLQIIRGGKVARINVCDTYSTIGSNSAMIEFEQAASALKVVQYYHDHDVKPFVSIAARCFYGSSFVASISSAGLDFSIIDSITRSKNVSHYMHPAFTRCIRLTRLGPDELEALAVDFNFDSIFAASLAFIAYDYANNPYTMILEFTSNVAARVLLDHFHHHPVYRYIEAAFAPDPCDQEFDEASEAKDWEETESFSLRPFLPPAPPPHANHNSQLVMPTMDREGRVLRNRNNNPPPYPPRTPVHAQRIFHGTPPGYQLIMTPSDVSDDSPAFQSQLGAWSPADHEVFDKTPSRSERANLNTATMSEATQSGRQEATVSEEAVGSEQAIVPVESATDAAIEPALSPQIPFVLQRPPWVYGRRYWDRRYERGPRGNNPFEREPSPTRRSRYYHSERMILDEDLHRGEDGESSYMGHRQ